MGQAWHPAAMAFEFQLTPAPFRIRLKTLLDPTDVGFLAQLHPSDVANFS